MAPSPAPSPALARAAQTSLGPAAGGAGVIGQPRYGRAMQSLAAAASQTLVDFTPNGIYIPFNGGLFGIRETYLVRVALPYGARRDHATVQTVDPNTGNVFFVRWDSADDTSLGSFWIHIGASALQGGTVECHVFGYYDLPPVFP